jgi:hypothetical protein
MVIERQNWRWSTETLVNAILVITCLWVVYSVSGPRATQPQQPQRESYRPGDRLSLNYIDAEAADKTLLLFVRSGCKFCTESMGFYSHLIDDIKNARTNHVRVIVVTSDDNSTAAEYLKSHAVQVDQVVADMFPPPKVWATPTVVIAGPDGLVRNAWTGKLNAGGERKCDPCWACRICAA